jgi:hypothetical protein
MKPSPVVQLTRSIIVYAILLAGLPVMQGSAFLTGGWTESVTLLILYFAAPLGAVWLASHQQGRMGAILLLGFMSSGIVINTMLFAGLMPPPFAQAIWVVLLRVWIILLIIVQCVSGWLAFRVLQEAHRQTPPSDPPPQG